MVKLAILGTILTLITLAGVIHLVRAYHGSKYVEEQARAGLEDFKAGRYRTIESLHDLREEET